MTLEKRFGESKEFKRGATLLSTKTPLSNKRFGEQKIFGLRGTGVSLAL
jgi:hypothetical protein